MPRARPTKCTPETVVKILTVLRLGVTRDDAAVYAGISGGTFSDWMKRGRSTRAKRCYRDFRKQVLEAERFGKLVALKSVHGAAQAGDWKAGAWYLERKYPNEFGRRDRVRVEAKAEVTAKVEHHDVRAMSTEELQRLAGSPPAQRVPVNGNGGNGA